MQISVETDTRRKKDTGQEASTERMAKVFVHNDDVTPYDFVIVSLVRFFKLDPQRAELVTRTAHTSGSALVAVLPLVVAQRKVGRAHFAASLEGYPLTYSIQAE